MNVKKKIRIITETYLRISQLYKVTCEGDHPPEARVKLAVVRSISGEVLLSIDRRSLAPKVSVMSRQEELRGCPQNSSQLLAAPAPR
jgi:hypothetical protein